jgi:hypothetical protein
VPVAVAAEPELPADDVDEPDEHAVAASAATSTALMTPRHLAPSRLASGMRPVERAAGNRSGI